VCAVGAGLAVEDAALLPRVTESEIAVVVIEGDCLVVPVVEIAGLLFVGVE